MSQRMPASTCTVCGKSLDANTPVGGEAVPSAGDVSVCLYCGTLATFNADGSLRPATPDELAEYLADDGVRRAVTLITTRNAYGPPL